MAKHSSELYFQLSHLLDAGISLPEAISSLIPQCPTPLKAKLEIVQKELNAGEIPPTAFEKAGFQKLELALIGVAEQTGDMAGCFRNLAKYVERSQKIQRKLSAGFAYPIILLLISPLILNVPLLFSVGASAFFTTVLSFYLYILVLIFGVLFFHKTFVKTYAYSHFLNQLPLIGVIRFKLSMARFCCALSNLLAGGISVEHSLKLSAEATNNGVYNQKISACLPGIRAGNSIYDEFEKLNLFPPIILQIIKTGEVAGDLPNSINRIDTMLSEEADHKLSLLVKILPVFLYLGVAVYLASKIIAFYSGYYSSLSGP